MASADKYVTIWQTGKAGSPLLRGAHHRTPTVILVTVHAALRIFLRHAVALRIPIHSLTRTLMIPLSFR